MIKKLIFTTMFFVVAFNFSVSAQLKGDPWIFQLYKEMYNRQPSAWELNINNYNRNSNFGWRIALTEHRSQ